MTETWYVLEDGSAADPRDIVTGKDGKMAHKDGRCVAYAPHGPRTRSVDADAEHKKAAPKAKESKPVEPKEPPTEARDMKAEAPKRGYTTRQSKAD